MAEEVLIKYVADTAQLEKRLKAVEDQLKDVGDEGKKATDKVSDGASGLEKQFNKLAIAVGTAFAVQKIIDFSREMQTLAIQIETTGKRMEVVFGSSAREVEKSAQKMASAVGLSNDEFKLMATQVGDVLVPLGLTRKEAAKMSTEAVKLAGALSEFSAGQVTMEQAVHAMVGAFTGEREALKTLGVVISEENVKERLLLKGQKDLEGQALATAKAFATFELITEKSADAQTFFANNTQSLARRTAEARAKIQTLREDIAKKLTPTILSVTEKFADFMEGMGVSDLIRFARVIGTVVSALVVYNTTVKVAGVLTEAFGKKWNATPLGLITAGVTALAVAIGTQNSELEQSARRQESYNEGMRRGEARVEDLTKAIWDNIEALQKQQEEEIESARIRGVSEAEIQAMRGRFDEETRKMLKTEYIERQKRLNILKSSLEELNTSSTKLYKLQSANRKKETIESKHLAYEDGIRHDMKMKFLAMELGFEGKNLTTAKLRGEIQAEINGLSEDSARIEQLASDMAFRRRLEKEKEIRREQDLLGAMEEKLKYLTDAVSKAKDFNEEQDLAKQIVDLQADIKERKIKLGLLKETNKEIKTESEIEEEAQKQRMALFQMFDDALTSRANFRKAQILDEIDNEKLRQKEIMNSEMDFIEQRILLYQKFGLNVSALMLQLSTLRRQISDSEKDTAKETAEQLEAVSDKVDSALTAGADSVEQYVQDTADTTLQSISVVGNGFMSLMRGLTDQSMGLAIMDVLLNQAVAIATAISNAQKSAGGTGPAAVITAPGFIAQMVGLTLSAFGQVFSIIKQAEAQQNQMNANTPRFARGVIGLTGEGSGTGDQIHAMLSAGESVITANRTRQYYDELSAIQSGTLQKLINTKYLVPALNASQSITVDANLNDRNIINQMKKQGREEKRRHEQLMASMNHRHVARKYM